MFDCSESCAHPSGILDNEQQSTSREISADENLLSKLALISKEITTVENSIAHDSGLKLSDPPDLNEILQTDEDLITPTAHNVGMLNSACQLVLKEMEYQLLKLLNQNRKEQQTVMGIINSKGKILDFESAKKNASFKCAGMPYFKDSDGFFPPDNEDVIAKRKNNELLPVDFIDIAPAWSINDTKNLIKAVNKYTKESNSDDGNSIDWLKISATDLDGKFSAIECKSKWLLHLKPGINRSRWGLKEMKSLEKIAEKHNYQDWDTISKELGTNRTGLQCCVKYHSHKTLTRKWSKEEDEELKKLIKKFKIKDYIPWAKVSWHFESRSLKQCQERYDYHLGNIKKGMFTAEEDFVLIYLATKLKNFGEVAKYLPNRVATQVRSRYEYLVKVLMPKFTKEEDKLLTKLMIQYPRNWGKISESFSNRSKLQCRRRWLELEKSIKLDKDIISEEEEEEELQMLNSNKTNTLTSQQKVLEELNLKKLSCVSKVKVTKKYSEEYSKLLEYHNHCHKFLFGPKPRIPTDSKESKQHSTFLKMIMSNLSVSPVAPLDTFNITSLSDNCEFDVDDVMLLKGINEIKESSTGGTHVSDKIIPPNYITLIGLRSWLLTRNKLGRLCEHYEPSTTCNDINSSNRLLFTDAKKLFKARMKALFAYPLILSNISQEGIDVKPVYKPKVRKGVKKMSKLRRKEHAKLMNQAYRQQKKLNEKLVDVGVPKEELSKTNSPKKKTPTRKRERKPKSEESKKDEEPANKKLRRTSRNQEKT